MKLFLILNSFLLLFGCNSAKGVSTEEFIYQRCISEITKEAQPNDSTVLFCPNKIRIAQEIITINAFEIFFREEIKEHTDDYVFDYDSQVSVVKLINSLGIRKASCVVFFSERKNGIMFAELFSDGNKINKFEDVPHFGTSRVFMFLVQEGQIHLVKAIDLIYG